MYTYMLYIYVQMHSMHCSKNLFFHSKLRLSHSVSTKKNLSCFLSFPFLAQSVSQLEGLHRLEMEQNRHNLYMVWL
uniref:Uncharacterized protein n=1 Tax=Octopus bimaculoides TaxID=37653 RepID=A0A0L8H7T1_OCTBM